MSNAEQAVSPPAPTPTTPTMTAPAEPLIPRLRSLTPAIFVPVEKLFPGEAALVRSAELAETDRAEHMRQALSRCDRHAAAVRGNILTLFRRENARLMQKMRLDEPGFLAEHDLERAEYERRLQEYEQVPTWAASTDDID